MLNKTEDTQELRNVDNTNSATTTESSDVAIESPRNPSLAERLAAKMFSESHEIFGLFIAIVISFAFAALQSSQPKLSKPPLAGPFFNQNSVVIDFYTGEVNAMIEQASKSDVTFIMYYAPWDAESQVVRHEFEIVAQHYHSQIFFTAINCWHPGSQCRAQYSKIQRYPVLVVYPIRGSGVQYKGINKAPYMMRFLEGFIKPIHRISTRDDLFQLQIKAESVFVGFLDFKGLSVSPGYKEFYTSALRILERDPNREILFAVVTNTETSRKEFNIEQFPGASLYLWNESLIYPSDKLWTSDNLIHWIDQSLHKVATWLQPPGIKSLTLAPYLEDGPVLFLFTPRNPLHQSNFNYNIIREIALRYYNCDDNILANKLVNSLEIERRIASEKYRKKTEQCLEFLSNINHQANVTSFSPSFQQWINDSCCAKVLMNKCLLCKSSSSIIKDVCTIEPKQFHEICSKKDIFKFDDEKDELNRHYCCDSYPPDDSKSKFQETVIKIENDSKSTSAVQKQSNTEECKKFISGNQNIRNRYEEKTNDLLEIEMKASACSANRSLAFIAIDSVHYQHFAEGLGIDLLKRKGKTAVIILDSLQESQYLMSEYLTKNKLVEFLNSYANRSLQRTFRSYNSKKMTKETQTCDSSSLSEICIPELTTDTFLKTVLDPTKDVVVLYHSRYCAFCSAVSYVFLIIAHYLSKMQNIIFVRIDGDSNDLPWEYSMNRYPSILFFPAKRKEDSTVYPFSLPITPPNLLNFILVNLESDSHIEALINVCHHGVGESPKDCVARTRRLCLDVIQKLLEKHGKLRRKSALLSKSDVVNKKREILIKLELIRYTHLILSSVDDLSKDKKYNLIITKFRAYYKNLKRIRKREFERKTKTSTTHDKKKFIKDEL